MLNLISNYLGIVFFFYYGIHYIAAHETHESEPVELWTSKILASLVMIIIVAIGVWIPIYIAKYARSVLAGDSRSKQKTLNILQSSLTFMNCFACGALFGLAMLHLLPEAVTQLEHSDIYLSLYGGEHKYQIAYLLGSIGFTVMLILDQFMADGHSHCNHSEAHSHILKPTLFLKETELPLANCVNISIPNRVESTQCDMAVECDTAAIKEQSIKTNATNDAECISVCCSRINDHCKNPEACKKIQYENTSACNCGCNGGSKGSIRSCCDHSHIPDSECRKHLGTSISTEHQSIPGLELGPLDDTAKKNGGVARLSLVLALSIHSVFEGIVIGMSQSVGTVWITAAAVLGHKGAEAIALSSTLQTMNLSVVIRRWSMIMFALTSPLGIIIGGLIVHMGYTFVGVMNALCVGVILYACIELMSEFSTHDSYVPVFRKVLRVGAFIIGLLTIFGLDLLHAPFCTSHALGHTGHHHHHHH